MDTGSGGGGPARLGGRDIQRTDGGQQAADRRRAPGVARPSSLRAFRTPP
ncbi:hypothetical protein SCATT_22950 [Streptantibioticus cattleyicolor NRRL 8057 = DSM 46488]|uniref:Uncharacterized protein n=1 Tax=Streptantibioticus cattleyicolor (strain ATCC 35852 / DSM 46488 / JCM 4925 / NBRC 14057 / NRRL 8057) TaxID=1003195 RepID=G8WQD4_STREN|nr:hypothetical protein SCATT_22950 [Streptantibioticus cattleyicolor NRRL 8057 = DSM 46488]